jgi:hypothetical protein
MAAWKEFKCDFIFSNLLAFGIISLKEYHPEIPFGEM